MNSKLIVTQEAMESFLTKIVNLMKDENLFASQGGPIILAQVILTIQFNEKLLQVASP